MTAVKPEWLRTEIAAGVVAVERGEYTDYGSGRFLNGRVLIIQKDFSPPSRTVVQPTLHQLKNYHYPDYDEEGLMRLGERIKTEGHRTPAAE